MLHCFFDRSTEMLIAMSESASSRTAKRGGPPQKTLPIVHMPISALSLYIDSLVDPFMDLAATKQARMKGAKAWRALNAAERTDWEQAAAQANSPPRRPSADTAHLLPSKPVEIPAAAQSLVSSACWCSLPAPPAQRDPSLKESVASGQWAVAQLLHDTWPDNGDTKNRYSRLQRSWWLCFALLQFNEPQTPGAPCVAVGTGTLRELRQEDGPQILALLAERKPVVVVSIAVPTELQGLGMGGTVLRLLEAEAREQQCTDVVLYAYVKDKLDGFYLKYGYQRVLDNIGVVPKPIAWFRKRLEIGVLIG